MQKTYYKRKAIQITVYSEKPRRRIKLVKSTHEEFCDRSRGHHQPPSAGAAYDRKAELLLYSRQLRAEASLEKSSSYKHQSQHKVKEILRITSIDKLKQAHLQKSNSYKSNQKSEEDLQITSGKNPHQKVKEVRQINPAVPWKVVPLENKPSQAKLPRPPPSCFGDWRNIFLPAFCMRKVEVKEEANEQRKKKKKKMNKKKKKITVSISDKMNAIMMSSRMEKERIGVMAKFLTAMRRRR
ncbi:hypothetical protein IEQ34_000839 [Dendrobium chrysotoxum]|uniref:Uncharacterized protein n=1 Tax=Dendrobium chrysotoxum TaxID=161865 RepID=A0AAV7HQ70_DENCH|nr:hypothetical protein IEQ34_000839 [Dendrobium chrysotoxum]